MSTGTSPASRAARIQALRSHLVRQPGDGRAWLELARALAVFPPARELYHAIEQAIRSLPDREAPWLLAAAIHERERGLEAALAWLDHSARQNPALAAPRRVIELLRSGGTPDGAWARGDALRQSGQWNEALREYRRIEGLQPDDAGLLINIGSCLASLEDHAAAEEYFVSALQREPASAQARMNLALLRALQGRRDEAIRLLEELLAGISAGGASRQAAGTMRLILLEQKRLQPFLDTALSTGDLADYREALEQKPSLLSQPHAETVETLRSLARQCSRLEIAPAGFRYASDISALPFVEACAQCNLDAGAADLARLYESMIAAPEKATLTDLQRRILHIWHVIRQRSALPADRLSGADGEALLTWLHARLLQHQPECMPGHYKMAANSIAGLPLTPPEFVSGTFRVLLADIRPMIPAGLGRAMFMYVALNMIHGFRDGNGRLARFVLSWEAEGCGMYPIPVPPAVRADVARAMDAAWLSGELRPLLAAFHAAHAETDRLLAHLHPPRSAPEDAPAVG